MTIIAISFQRPIDVFISLRRKDYFEIFNLLSIHLIDLKIEEITQITFDLVMCTHINDQYL